MARDEASLIGWTHLIYALHAFSILTGILGSATVFLAFLTGWPSIIAVILNYVKRGDVAGTWLESHFRWQIRTFWYGVLWAIVCGIVLVLTLGFGIIIVAPLVFLLTLWLIYRIARGWSALGSRRPMPV